jgi:Family of unknown function (DUF6282)
MVAAQRLVNEGDRAMEEVESQGQMVDALPRGFDSLVRGAFDVHMHGQPDLSAALENRGPDLGAARLAHSYGMRGWVLKSHLFPTMDRARALNESLGDIDFTVLGSITLNPPAGGVSSTVVDFAAAHGARVVFLPTWSAAADVERGGYITTLLERVSSSFAEYSKATSQNIADANGRLTGAAVDVVEACRSHGLVLATGHISLAESLAIERLCAEVTVPLMITHPSHFTQDVGVLREFTELGAYVEFSGAPLLHPRGHERVLDVFEKIQALGAERVILSSDVFSRWVPPEPECLRILAEQLFYLGCSRADLRRMLVENPHNLLGLPVPALPPEATP